MVRFALFCGHEQWHPEEIISYGGLAREAGFDMVVCSEHFHPWVDDVGCAGFAWSTLGGLSIVCSGMGLGMWVTTPLFRYHPGVVAQAAATMDRLCDGDFILGVGTGENINEAPLGYTFPPYSERAARMEEALDIMRGLLDGECLSYEGEYYRTKRARLYSPPLSRVPILLAAGGPKSARLAGRKAEGVAVSVKDPQAAWEKVVAPAREEADKRGNKDFLLAAARWVVWAGSEDEAWEALFPWRGLRAPGRLQAFDPEDLRCQADTLSKQEVLSKYTIVDTVQDFVEAYKPLIRDLGAGIVVIQVAACDAKSVIGLIGKEVLPALRAL